MISYINCHKNTVDLGVDTLSYNYRGSGSGYTDDSDTSSAVITSNISSLAASLVLQRCNRTCFYLITALDIRVCYRLFALIVTQQAVSKNWFVIVTEYINN